MDNSDETLKNFSSKHGGFSRTIFIIVGIILGLTIIGVLIYYYGHKNKTTIFSNLPVPGESKTVILVLDAKTQQPINDAVAEITAEELAMACPAVVGAKCPSKKFRVKTKVKNGRAVFYSFKERAQTIVEGYTFATLNISHPDYIKTTKEYFPAELGDITVLMVNKNSLVPNEEKAKQYAKDFIEKDEGLANWFRINSELNPDDPLVNFDSPFWIAEWKYPKERDEVRLSLKIDASNGQVSQVKFLNDYTFYKIDQNHNSGHPERKNYVITNEEEWKELQSKVYSDSDYGPPPHVKSAKIDFSKETVIAVFSGEKAGVYTAQITRVVGNGNFITVAGEEGGKSEGSQPFHIIKMKKIDKEIKFDIKKVDKFST